MIIAPFSPRYGAGQIATPATTATLTIGKGSKNMCITNTGAALGYFKIADAGATNASAADHPVPAGAQIVVSKAQDHDTVYFYCATSTTMHAMPGEGW